MLTYDTEIGLAAGLGVSAGTIAFDMAFSDTNKPLLVKTSKDNNGVDVVRLRQDLNFITTGKVRDFILQLTLIDPAEQRKSENTYFSLGKFHYGKNQKKRSWSSNQ